jgi:hypothetical protein
MWLGGYPFTILVAFRILTFTCLTDHTNQQATTSYLQKFEMVNASFYFFLAYHFVSILVATFKYQMSVIGDLIFIFVKFNIRSNIKVRWSWTHGWHCAWAGLHPVCGYVSVSAPVWHHFYPTEKWALVVAGFVSFLPQNKRSALYTSTQFFQLCFLCRSLELAFSRSSSSVVT